MSFRSGYLFDRNLLPSLLDPSAPPSNPFIAGVDEAGRGPLAGPVVAAAVVLPASPQLSGLRDSKILTAETRERLFDRIVKVALGYAVAVIDATIIDEINILQATLRAMREAIVSLPVKPALVCIDGNCPPRSGLSERTIVKGDRLSASIMAAGILAKVTRDRLMMEAHAAYPHYGFDRHKGYGSSFHLTKLREHGPCPLHRRSFSPVKDFFSTMDPLRKDVFNDRIQPENLTVPKRA